MLIPGKTFLSGEYAVLECGSAITFATKPFFEFSEAAQINYEKIIIHSESAAGLYLKKNNQVINEFHLKNNYQAGGFGQSTAEFIYCWLKINNQKWPLKKDQHLKIYQDYLSLYEKETDQRPSGADLLALINGGLSVFKNDRSAKVQNLVWPFDDRKVLIFSTGLKIKTHEHLQKLDRKICADLVEASDMIVRDFLNKDEDSFLIGLKAWVQTLANLNLTHPDILEKIKVLTVQQPECLFKPCGALGADVILAIVPNQLQNAVINCAEQLKLKYQTSSSDLSIF